MSITIPSRKTCLELIDYYGMLDNIRQHSFVVARVAETIIQNLNLSFDKDIFPPDRDLVLAGALLHDIAKTKCLDGSCRHAEEGEQICIDHDFPDVGTIVGEHVILKSFTPENYRRGYFGAREIVYYSDKRVTHTTIVSLEDRLKYIVDRYGDGSSFIEDRIRDNFQHCLKLEKYLFSFLPFAPEDLASLVSTQTFT
jgi:uncharacterized protein